MWCRWAGASVSGSEARANWRLQEAVVVIKDIFRKYPNKYEGIISTLCENLDTLDEPEARASMIWIIGEYAERIDNADELLDSFVEGFHDENTQASRGSERFGFSTVVGRHAAGAIATAYCRRQAFP